MSEARKKEDKSADRRQQILRAAVDVFAERGFHRTRVSDIARRADVAYGLIYHYFQSKDDVLSCVFEENWSVFLKVLRELEADADKAPAAKLEQIAHLLIDALSVAPAVIQVIIQEVSRSDRLVQSEKLRAFDDAIRVVESIIKAGQDDGSFQPQLDPGVLAYGFFGALETVCTGLMLESLACEGGPELVKATVTGWLVGGLQKKNS